MLASAYADTIVHSAASSRSREREALQHSVALLQKAKATGFRTHAGAEAIYTANRVWSYLIEDLSLSENELPDEIRANLISIGIHVLRQLDRLRSGETAIADDIIDITNIIEGGLA
jgi:flagellar biosynthesis activator protein FlaF